MVNRNSIKCRNGEMVDAKDLKSFDSERVVRVQVSLPVLNARMVKR